MLVAVTLAIAAMLADMPMRAGAVMRVDLRVMVLANAADMPGTVHSPTVAVDLVDTAAVDFTVDLMGIPVADLADTAAAAPMVVDSDADKANIFGIRSGAA